MIIKLNLAATVIRLTTMITLHKLDFSDAQTVLSSLDKKFGLVWSGKNCVLGNTITAVAEYDEELSAKYTSARYTITIQSSFYVDSTLLNAVGDFGTSYFIK